MDSACFGWLLFPDQALGGVQKVPLTWAVSSWKLLEPGT
jgi:hypothetical protein